MEKRIGIYFQYVIAAVIAFIFVFNIGFCEAKRLNSVRQKTKVTKYQKSGKEYAAKQMIVMDFDTGEILFSNNANTRCIPSSMTKMMTLYLLFEALESKKLLLDDIAPVSEFAKNMEGSRSFFEAGTFVKIEDLIRSVIVHSGNDGCVIIAEKIAGDEEAFVDMMNEKATLFGLHDTHFMNSTGLPHEEHYSTLYDLAVIACRLIRDFPQYYHYFSEKSFTVNGITQQNRNKLLGEFLNVDGLKTGQTGAGGYGIVVSAKNNGKRLIVVVNGCDSDKSRINAAKKLLTKGFNEYIPITIADVDTPVGSALVSFGKREKIDIYCKENIVISIPKRHKQSLLVELDVGEPIEAPIYAGGKLGALTYKYGNYVSRKYELYARDTVERVSFIKRIMLNVVSFFANGIKKADKDAVNTPIGIKSL